MIGYKRILIGLAEKLVFPKSQRSTMVRYIQNIQYKVALIHEHTNIIRDTLQKCKVPRKSNESLI